MHEFWIFALIGFVAQIIDSSLGMGFGIISTSVLLSHGVPPALVSASVNAAKLPTTGTAALSHFMHRNLRYDIVLPVTVFGVIGGSIGALILTSLKGKALASLVTAYLFLIGAIIVWRGISGIAPKLLPSAHKRVIGLIGGLVEGIGGSWGPIVTTSLMGAGTDSRYAIGSSNFAEFIVSIGVFSTFLLAYLTGYWEGGSEWQSVSWPVAGLVAGGIPAAVIGGFLAKITPRRALTIAVGMLALGIAVYRVATV
jgi:uncharacterized protein